MNGAGGYLSEVGKRGDGDMRMARSWVILCVLASLTSVLANIPKEFAYLKRLAPLEGFEPTVVVDGGAYRGAWTKAARQLWPDAEVIMIEPSGHKQAELERLASEIGNAHVMQCVLSDNTGTAHFFDGGTGASMFKESTDTFANANAITLPACTLDAIVEELGVGAEVGLVKLDLQGAELVALRGMTAVLRRAWFVVLEMSIVAYNDGGACYFEVDEFLRSAGYRLFDAHHFMFDPKHFNSPGAGQYDAVYVREDVLESYEVSFCEGRSYSVARGPEEGRRVEERREEPPHRGAAQCNCPTATARDALFVIHVEFGRELGMIALPVIVLIGVAAYFLCPRRSRKSRLSHVA